MLVTIAALSFLMSVHLLPDKISLRLGDVSDREVRANRSVSYINFTETARRQQAAAQSVQPIYDVDEAASVNTHRIVLEFFDRIERERALYHLPKHLKGLPQAVSELKAPLGSQYSPAQLKHLLTLSPAVLQELRTTAIRLVDDAMDREIRDQTGDLLHARQDVVNAANTMLADEDAAIAGEVARQSLRPNRLLDRRKTEDLREAKMRAVQPVRDYIARGDKIIGAGERVTQEHLDKFTALGLLNPHLEPTTGFAVCVLAAAMVFLVVFNIARTLPALYADRRRLALLTVIVLLSVFGIKLGATMLGLNFSNGQLGYLGMMSVAAAGMLVSVLLDRNLAVLIVALLSVQSGVIMNHEIRFTVLTLLSSLVAIFTVGGVRRKLNLLGAAVILAGANLGLVWLLGLLLRDSMPELLSGSAWAVCAAFFSTFLCWFGVLALEKPFGILTHTTLLEMSAFDRPLLTQLCAAAPGTYAHSVMVGTLAEAGAQAIGADALLCRVGGYYHDIGKVKHPEFFVENQRRENVHCRLSPSLSALIITAHVRDGIEMAHAHRLPDEIRDIIAQHHGTSLIRYFYHQALTDCGGSEEAPPGLEERFRYPGPKPRTREAALVMLADTVEAAARCLDKPSRERLESLIAALTRDKIEDGQLDDCDLTFRDLKGISNAFLHVLSAMMHGRIDYPETTPRTASGLPMEVVRPDLRPEPPAPLARAEVPMSMLPLADAAPETTPAVVAEHDYATNLEAHALEAVYALEFGSEIATGGSSSAPLPARALPRREPEENYGRLAAERPSAPDSDARPASGSLPPAPGGRPGPRRG